MMVMLLMTLTSCRKSPEYPEVIADTGNSYETQSSLATSLGVVMAWRGAYHLEDGYSQEYGMTLSCLSKDKQYTVAFYKPENGRLVLVGSPVAFGEQWPSMTVYNGRQAIKGSYKGKKRIAYVNSGKLVIENDR